MTENIATNKRDRKILIIAGVALLIEIIMIVAITFGMIGILRHMSYTEAEKCEALQNSLMDKTWVTYSTDYSSKLYFEFSEDTVKYSSKFLSVGNKTKLAVMDYIACDEETIYVNEILVQVEIEDGYVIFTPSFVDDREYLICEEE